MSTIPTLVLVQQYITRYVLSTIIAFGTLGNLIAIAIFLQKRYRTNSCSIYLAAVSCFGLFAANWAITPLVYALDNFDVVNSSVVLCRIRGYIIHVNAMCFRYTLILMCVDRYALCNSRASVRALCRPKIAYRSIGCVFIFWIIGSSHLLIWESIENNRCSVYGLYGQIYSFYILIFSGIVPISMLTLITILVIKELRHLRSRIGPLNNMTRLNRRDRSLIKIVLVEAIIYILLTFANPLVMIYTQITNSMTLNKSAQRRQIESFTSFITQSLLQYLNYNVTFYVHIFTSPSYRAEVKRLILKSIGKLRDTEQIQANVPNMENQITTRQQAPRTTTT